MAKNTLGKDKRLKSRKLIERVFRSGKGFSLFPYRITYVLDGPAGGIPGEGRTAVRGPQAEGAGSEDGGTAIRERQANAEKKGSRAGPARASVQAGFGATRRNFKHAVDRNRIKRLTREAYRLQQHALADRVGALGKTPFVFFIYTGKEIPDQASVMQKMGVILQKLITQLDRERS